MINQCVIVGKIKEVPVVETTQKGNSIAHMVVETDKSFRNEDGTLSTDTFRVLLWKGIAEECASICQVGDIIGLKGRLSSNNHQGNERYFYNCEIVAEKVSFLSRRMENQP